MPYFFWGHSHLCCYLAAYFFCACSNINTKKTLKAMPWMGAYTLCMNALLMPLLSPSAPLCKLCPKPTAHKFQRTSAERVPCLSLEAVQGADIFSIQPHAACTFVPIRNAYLSGQGVGWHHRHCRESTLKWYFTSLIAAVRWNGERLCWKERRTNANRLTFRPSISDSNSLIASCHRLSPKLERKKRS